MNKKILSHFLAIALMIIWGLSYLSIKVIVKEVEPTLSALYRFLVSLVILFIVYKTKYSNEKVLKEDKIRLAMGGLFGIALYFFFENYSVYFTSASNVAILISTIPVFTLFIQGIVYKEKITWQKVFGAFFSLIGIVVIIVSKERVSLFSKGSIGDFMVLGAVISWILYNIFTNKFKGNYSSATISLYQTFWGCLFLSPSLFFSKLSIPSTKVILNILFLSVLCSCLGIIIYIFCLKNLGPTVITTYINLQPIVSLISAGLIINEEITKWQIIGCSIIIMGVFLVSFGDKIIKNARD
ncbi:DMT family transporter [Haloimpatiens sp. FM7315]|uniref:DMT family transporter n=1 Tax=Haloimpatiens sp. FM7315 TaxID=3298609 RepID=UPI0035A29FCD